MQIAFSGCSYLPGRRGQESESRRDSPRARESDRTTHLSSSAHNVRARGLQQREALRARQKGGPHALGQPQRVRAIRTSYHHHELGTGEGVLAKARETKCDQHEDRNSENSFASAAFVTKSQISFSKGYLILPSRQCGGGTGPLQNTVVVTRLPKKYTYIHTSPLSGLLIALPLDDSLSSR